ncbi:hypothetical protein D8Y24_07385 [Agrococcus lahaulensis]|nr:hypothetical protein D8Y24_07385 [Agrococcus lahaulensis]
MFRFKDWYNRNFDPERLASARLPLVLSRPAGSEEVFDGAFQWLDLEGRVALTFLGSKKSESRDDALEGLIHQMGWSVRRMNTEAGCIWSLWMVSDDDRPIEPLIDLSTRALWPFGSPEPALETPFGSFPADAGDDVEGLGGDSSGDEATRSEPEQYVFEFQVRDDEVTAFRCRAGSIDQAMAWARIAGHESAVLVSQAGVPAGEETDTARAGALEDPLLGPRWMPLVDALAGELDNLPAHRPRTVQTYAAKYWFDPNRSPYFQFLRQADGSVLAEVWGPSAESLHGSPDWENRLRLLGWRLRGDQVASLQTPLLREQLDSPNPTKRFDADQSGFTIVRTVLTMIVFSWEVDDQDLFNLSGHPEVFDSAEGLERVEGKPIFRIGHRSPTE